MREIKFRFFDTYKKEMSYEMDLETVTVHKDIDFANSVVMQLTGLKDKNGVEIYEGDILNVKEDSMWGGEYNIAVEWVDYDTDYDKWAFWGCLAIEAKEIEHRPDFDSLFTRGFLTRRFGSCIQLCEMTRKGFEIEVIGNIYQNPELLK